MTEEQQKDKVRGSLIGGAIGDALGYPVEFMSRKHILSRFGENGITRFALDYNSKALITQSNIL